MYKNVRDIEMRASNESLWTKLQSLVKFINNQCMYVIWVKCHKVSIND